MRRHVVGLLLALAPLNLSAQQIDVAAIYEQAAPSVALVIVYDERGDTLAFGSGFFIDGAGTLATNYHVIAGASSASVKLGEGLVHDVAGVLASDREEDLALLRVVGYDSDPLELAAGKPRVGEPVVAIGNPMGFEGTVSEGILSGIRSMAEGRQRYQITAPISPGSSGGPVLNATGEVVGVATFTWKEGQNLNFAVPASSVVRLQAMVEEPEPLTVAAAAGPATGFETLNIAGRLAVGLEAAGELTQSDDQLSDGSFVQAWGLDLEQGQSVSVDMVSGELDPFLIVAGPGLAEPLMDDDGAGACDSRITFTAPESGTFRVLANSVQPAEVGRFVLRVTQEPGPLTPGECVAAGGEDQQVDMREFLMSLPLAGRMLSMGTEVEGELSTDDVESWDGSFAQAWGLELTAGESATVDLRSEDFDSYLWVVGPGIPQPLFDDDGAGLCDSRITFTAAESGRFRVVVNTLDGGWTGRFHLSVTGQPGPVAAGECELYGEGDVDAELANWIAGLPVAGKLTLGDEVAGQLTASDHRGWDDTFVQVWELSLRAGEQATVDLLSTDFDAYLMLVGPGIEGMLADDDGAGACNSRLTFTASGAGVYRVAVNTLGTEATGAFRLRVSRDPPPTANQRCDQMGEYLEGFDDLIDEYGDADAELAAWLAGLRAVGEAARGSVMDGELTASDAESADGSFVQVWGLELSRGQSATVDLRSSDFDAYLMIVGPGLEGVMSDDDGAGGCDSRITFTAPASGVYKLVVNTIAAGSTGKFSLGVSERPGPVSGGDCSMF